MLFRSVGIEEIAGNIAYGFSVPYHFKAGFFLYHRYRSGFKIFFSRKGNKFIRVFLFHHHSHSFLRFGNSQLGAVQAVILFGNRVQVYFKTIRQLADGHGNSARAEVVAALYKGCGFGISEQSLKLALFWGVALLYLRAAAFEAFHAVGL